MVGSEVGVGVGSSTGSGVGASVGSSVGSDVSTGAEVGSTVGSGVGNGSSTGTGVGVGAGSTVGAGSDISPLNAEVTVSASTLSDANDSMKGITVVKRAKHNAKALIFMIRPPCYDRFILNKAVHGMPLKQNMTSGHPFINHFTTFSL